ncbi:hypothetical protein LTS10_013021 [Elasticomyces elasticus]|nr:hypothetical protein LTS10_013021 [Elasticomyces elasticus]
MRLSQSKLAVGTAVFSTALLLWFTLSQLSAPAWTSFQWHAKPSHNVTEALIMENGRLQQALENARMNLAKEKMEVDRLLAVNKTLVEAGSTDKLHSTKTLDGFAYVFYATSDPYACSVLVNIHRLHNVLNSTLPIHVLASSDVGESYMAAFNAANAIVHIEQAPALKDTGADYYQDCMLKLLAFKMQLLDPSLKRVLAFDSDQLIMRNLDHLFAGLPDVDLAAPRAYWLAKDFLASTFLMINLSNRLWRTVKAALDSIEYNKFDMDLINDLLGDSVMMLSGEYVTLNSHWEDWNLPRWYHPMSRLNMTTVEMWNDLAKAEAAHHNRRDENGLSSGLSPNMPQVQGFAEFQRPHTLTAVPPHKHTPAGSPRFLPLAEGAVLDIPSSIHVHPPTESVPLTTPRFPANHPMTLELYRLQDAAAVVHFTAQGKPWMKPPSLVRSSRPDAHPVLAEQFDVWRKTAEIVCPGGVPGGK